MIVAFNDAWVSGSRPSRFAIGRGMNRVGLGNSADTCSTSYPLSPYDLSIAQAHGRPMAGVHRSGTRRGAHDLIIAATAAVTRRTIVTVDRSVRFDELPGVECVVLQ